MNIIYHHRTQAEHAEGVHIREIIKAFQGLGHMVHVVSPQGVDPFQAEVKIVQGEGKRLPFRKIISKYLPQVGFELLEIGYNLSVFLRVTQLIKTHKIDFIYERYAFFCGITARLARRQRIPFVVEVNEVSGLKRTRGQVFIALAQRIERSIFKKADIILVVSSFLKSRIAALGISESKIHVIPNAVNLARFDVNVKSGEGLRKQLALTDALVLGFVGCFVRWHNFDFMLQVVQNIAARDCPQLRLLLVGDGPMLNDVKAEVRKRNLDDHVVFAGAVEHALIPAYIDAMDICIIPHSNEFRSPIKLFEYMAMAKPVVAPRVEPISSVVIDGHDGILFEPNNIETCEAGIRKLIVAADERARIGKNARAAIVAKYTWEKNAQKVIAYVQGCVHQAL